MAKKTRRKSAKRASKRARPSSAGKRSTGVALQEFCRSLPHVVEDVKWGADLMFSVGVDKKVKMFAGFEVDNADEFAFKCDEQDFLRLIQIEGIIPAPYAAKYFWVKVYRPAAQTLKQWQGLISKAHGIVAASLPVGVQKRMNL